MRPLLRLLARRAAVVRITDAMVVASDKIPDDAADMRWCPKSSTLEPFVVQRVLVFSAGGARTMRLWGCEKHPLPDMVSDDPDKET